MGLALGLGLGLVLALGGIAVVNVLAFGDPGGAPGMPPPPGPVDRAALFVVFFLAESKFFCLFSLLFGYGFAALSRRDGFGRRYARRLLALAAFGAAHVRNVTGYGDGSSSPVSSRSTGQPGETISASV